LLAVRAVDKSKREYQWTEERVAKSMGIELNRPDGRARVAIGWNRDTDRSAEWERRAA